MSSQFTLGQSFPTLGARILYAYLASYPAFVFMPGEVSSNSQQQLHSFFRDVIQACASDPERIGIAPQPDRCFEERWYLNNRDPELMDAMAGIEKKFFDWVAVLHKLGMLGEIRSDSLFVPRQAWKLSSSLLGRLAQFGLTCDAEPDGVSILCPAYPALFPAMKQRSTIPGAGGQITSLTRFLFGSAPGQPFRAVQMFGKLYEDSAWLLGLESFFEGLGYVCSSDERNLQVRWEKEYKDKEHGYFKVSYRWRDRLQMCFEFRVPGFRLLLKNHYLEMEYALGELCFTRTKVCDNCGYCTQTDKSGKREKLAISLKYPDGETLKCPLWPWFTWNELDDEALAKIKKLFLFAEEKLYGESSK